LHLDQGIKQLIRGRPVSSIRPITRELIQPQSGGRMLFLRKVTVSCLTQLLRPGSCILPGQLDPWSCRPIKPVLHPRAIEAGCETPIGLGQPDETSGARTHPVSGVALQPRGTGASNSAEPSLTSGLSSFPGTPEVRSEDFIAEARGTCQTTTTTTAVIVLQEAVVGQSH